LRGCVARRTDGNNPAESQTTWEISKERFGLLYNGGGDQPSAQTVRRAVPGR